MEKLKTTIILGLTVLLLALLPFGVGYAHGGEDASELEAQLQTVQEAQTKASAITRGQAAIAELKAKQKQASTVEMRKTVCESKQAALQSQMQTVVTAGRQQYKDLDAILDPVIAYNPGADVPDLDRLVARARADEGTAQIALNIMEFMNVKIGCDKDTAALDVATFKAASEQARDALTASQKSIRAVVQAVSEAAK
jgi:hypothetical protein